jgi:hypothetical protein
MENSNKIELVQLPVIKHELQRIGAEITVRIKSLNLENQVATEDTVKTLKAIRAELNKEVTVFEAQRKEVKNAVMQPYNYFETVYKAEITDKYKEADETLKSKISEFEITVKTGRRNALIAYFNELCEFHDIDFLKFESIISEINLSTSEKKYKEQIFEAINRINEDLELIRTETHAAEILTEYKRTLKASAAIAEVRTRKEAEKLERERLVMNRTNKRTNALHALAFTYSDITKTYRFIQDETIFVKLSDVETLENDEWNKKYILLENLVKQLQKQSVSAPKTETQAPKQTEQPKAETKPEETFVATFEVIGTYAELTSLKNFLVENNYNYKNI